MPKWALVAIGVVVGIIVIAWSVVGGTYNKLVGLEESVKESWAQVQNVYQRRLDLIPNLVETVRGYAAHEKETLEGVVEARSKAASIQATPELVNNPQAMANFEAAQESLSSALSRLMVVVERYPDLKANQNFLTLQTQLEGTENRIAVERMRFNEASRQFNTAVRTFPTNLIAGLYGFSAKAYFQAAAGAEKAPVVSF
ncbi:MAG: LemA family protein [Candidatus Omnitrophica bacterium]|nr:LemA family protein [Candidatus Omnitrophota bacterium]